MSGELDRARRYRFRAEELRSISSSWTMEEVRQILARVAADYDRMAVAMEKRVSPEDRA